jgi:hypothetical protein
MIDDGKGWMDDEVRRSAMHKDVKGTLKVSQACSGEWRHGDM